MADRKQCPKCLTPYPADHWAFAREVCPTCGVRLVVPDEGGQFTYEHYDSNTDIQFDLEGLLTPDQRREVKAVGWLGLALILLAFVARLLFVVFGGLQGFWGVPIWFDAIVLLMVLLGSGMVVWSLRRLARHRRALRRGQ